MVGDGEGGRAAIRRRSNAQGGAVGTPRERRNAGRRRRTGKEAGLSLGGKSNGGRGAPTGGGGGGTGNDSSVTISDESLGSEQSPDRGSELRPPHDSVTLHGPVAGKRQRHLFRRFRYEVTY